MAVMPPSRHEFARWAAWTGLAALLDFERKSLQHDGNQAPPAGAAGPGLAQASHAEIV
jgi:hypothetical protein